MPPVGTGPSSSLSPQPHALGEGDGFRCKAWLPSLQMLGRDTGDTPTASHLSCFGGWGAWGLGLGDLVGELRAHPDCCGCLMSLWHRLLQAPGSRRVPAPRCQHPAAIPGGELGEGLRTPAPPGHFTQPSLPPLPAGWDGWMESRGNSRCFPPGD